MFRALNVILGKEHNSEYLSFQKEECNGLQMGLAKSSTYILLLLMTANKYCSSLPSVCGEQYVCISVQQGTSKSCSVTPVLPAELDESMGNPQEYPGHVASHSSEFKCCKRLVYTKDKGDFKHFSWGRPHCFVEFCLNFLEQRNAREENKSFR